MFVLVVILGLGEDRRVMSDPDQWVFDDISRCNAVASELSKRYGHVTNPADFVVTYCLPKNEAKDGV